MPAVPAPESNASEVERLHQALAQERAEFQEFVYAVSHDLRAPLRHINAFAKIIEEDWPDKPVEVERHLTTIRQSAQLLAQQLDGLATLSRLGQQHMQLQAVDVSTLIQSLAAELSQRHATRQVQWQLAQDVPQLQADSELLRQLFLNLLDNAMKFTRDRHPAHIALSWSLAPDEPGWCQLKLRDNGIGFAPAQAAQLFKVFAKLHPVREFEGLGLGLVASRKLVQRLGGRIEITAQPDLGCQVTVILPLA